MTKQQAERICQELGKKGRQAYVERFVLNRINGYGICIGSRRITEIEVANELLEETKGAR